MWKADWHWLEDIAACLQIIESLPVPFILYLSIYFNKTLIDTWVHWLAILFLSHPYIQVFLDEVSTTRVFLLFHSNQNTKYSLIQINPSKNVKVLKRLDLALILCSHSNRAMISMVYLTMYFWYWTLKLHVYIYEQKNIMV